MQFERSFNYKAMPFLMKLMRNIKRDKYLLLLMFPIVLYYAVFHYWPIYGAQIAFKNFQPALGIVRSPWIGFSHFTSFFQSTFFPRLISNTIILSVYSLLWGFPIPIIFALLLNEIRDGIFKRVTQTISYLPYFISIVVVVSLLNNFFSQTDGLINNIRQSMGLSTVGYLDNPGLFRTMYIASGVWQHFGWGSIIYIAAISGVDPTLYEVATIDGCSRWKQVFFVTLPSILPTIIIQLLLSLGSIMSIGHEKVYAMQRPLNMATSDIISVYVYQRGIIRSDFGFGSAIGLFNSVINFSLLLFFNKVSRRVTQISLF